MLYRYRCHSCGELLERIANKGFAPERPVCDLCGGRASRSYPDEVASVVTDPDLSESDFAIHAGKSSEFTAAGKGRGRPLKSRCLARSLARVPGTRKYRGKDGKMYAAFTSKADRRKTLAGMGIESD